MTKAFAKLTRRLSRLWIGKRLRISSLEINVASHCNLKCYGCGRGSPALDKEFVSLEELQQDLDALSKTVRVSQFKLAGGEPSLHPQLADIIDLIRASGITQNITLITNGLLLHKYADTILPKIDELWLSAYPGVKRKINEDSLRELCQRHNVRLAYNQMLTFTRRLLNNPNEDNALVRDIYSNCYQRGGCHSIYQGKFYQCATGPFIEKWLKQIGQPVPDFSQDGVELHNKNFTTELSEHLRRDEPLKACRYCLGGIGETIPNRQANQKELEAWMSENHTNVPALINRDQLNTAQSESNTQSHYRYGHRINLGHLQTGC
jgi:cyclic pyranopterin phosphate synthase